MKAHLKGIAEMFNGDYLASELYSIYATPSSGKTLFLIGEAVQAIKNGYRVLWLDTEGGFDGLWNYWRPIYDKRFDGKYNDSAFFYKRFSKFEDMMAYLGESVEFDFTKSKTEMIYHGKIKKGTPTVYDDFGRLKGKTLIIIDSLTNIFRHHLVTSTQNFPVRADATGMLISTLILLAARVEAPVIATNHASLNPTDRYQAHADMRGGNTLYYSSKYIVLLDRPRKKVLQSFRHIWAVRTPIAQDWAIDRWVKITNDGYIDSSEEEIEKTIDGKNDASEQSV